MLEPLAYRPLDYTLMGGLLSRGRSILGTSSKGHFAAKTGHGEVRPGGVGHMVAGEIEKRTGK